jgi:hypothetical protein
VPVPSRLIRLTEPATIPERGGDLDTIGAARQQDMQQQPGLERVEKPGADQAVAEQVPLRAGEAVGFRSY